MTSVELRARHLLAGRNGAIKRHDAAESRCSGSILMTSQRPPHARQEASKSGARKLAVANVLFKVEILSGTKNAAE